jgi:L-2-hydroxyglutarate oxidase
MERPDVAVVGGGILGTSVAFWLASRFDGRVTVLEREPAVAEHASRRNTGVVHRPFYLHPRKARVFARAAGVSYHLWKKYAAAKALPWNEVGTYEVALENDQVGVLETYMEWADENGMAPGEVELLDGRELSAREPNVRGAAALCSRTDTAVDYHAFTEALKADAEALGVRFLTGAVVKHVTALGSELEIALDGGRPALPAKYLIGCAGGEAVDLAHAMGVGLEYTDIHFRGEYWVVADGAANLAKRNVYSVPRHPDLPFLDPHWVVRANGRREIGPNAVPVPGPRAYEGLLWPMSPWIEKFLEPPVGNKVRLAMNRDFLALSVQEMWSSLSKGEMLRRVQRFLPALGEEHLVAQGTAGIRSPVVNRDGAMMKEAIEIPGPHSYHILNYNSPGATGAPAYAAYLVDRLAARGDLDHLKKNPKPPKAWDWDVIATAMGFGA